MQPIECLVIPSQDITVLRLCMMALVMHVAVQPEHAVVHTGDESTPGSEALALISAASSSHVVTPAHDAAGCAVHSSQR